MTATIDIEHRRKYSYPGAIRGFWISVVLAVMALFLGSYGLRQKGVKSPIIPSVAFFIATALLANADHCSRQAKEDERVIARDRVLSNRKIEQIQAHSYFPEESGLKAIEEMPMAPTPIYQEDLAATMAQMTVDARNAGSVLIACAKGTGKSNLLRAATHGAYQQNQGKIEFNVFAGKDGETYCGLERDNQRYIYSGARHAMPEVLDRMESCARHCDRDRGFPTVQISDEYNNTLAAAKMAVDCGDVGDIDPETGKIIKIKYQTLIPATTYERVTKGRSKRVVDWITSHSPFVEDLGFNTAIQESLDIIALARGNKMAAIDKILANRRQLIFDDKQRERLKEQWDYYKDPNDFNTVYALTNLAGDWRLCSLPKYPDNQPDITGNFIQSTKAHYPSFAIDRNQPVIDVEPIQDQSASDSLDIRTQLEKCLELSADDESKQDQSSNQDNDIELLNAYKGARSQGISPTKFLVGYFSLASDGGNAYRQKKALLDNAIDTGLEQWISELQHQGIDPNEMVSHIWNVRANKSNFGELLQKVLTYAST